MTRTPEPTKPDRWCVALPAKYGSDAYDRLEAGFMELKSENKRRVVLCCDLIALKDLASDADYYADPRGFEPEVAPLCRSAARALPTIRAALAKAT